MLGNNNNRYTQAILEKQLGEMLKEAVQSGENTMNEASSNADGTSVRLHNMLMQLRKASNHPCVVKLLFAFSTPKHLYMVPHLEATPPICRRTPPERGAPANNTLAGDGVLARRRLLHAAPGALLAHSAAFSRLLAPSLTFSRLPAWPVLQSFGFLEESLVLPLKLNDMTFVSRQFIAQGMLHGLGWLDQHALFLLSRSLGLSLSRAHSHAHSRTHDRHDLP